MVTTTYHKVGTRHFPFTEYDTVPSYINNTRGYKLKRHYLVLESIFPAEGPKDGMTQLWVKKCNFLDNFLTSVAQL